MKLTHEEVQAIARLARLEINRQETAMYADQLSAVLEYVEMLGEIDTESVEETTQVTGLSDVLREDEVVEPDPDMKRALVEHFPYRTGSLLKVRAVFAESDDAQ